MTIHIKPLLFASALFLVYSCSINKKQVQAQVDQNFIGPNKVAFIEYIQTQDGKVISGIVPEGRRIDGPTYHFDKETKRLEIYRKVNFSTDTIKAILGNGGILKGAAGSGLSLRLTPISKFPFIMNQLTISKVNIDGLYIIFDNKEHLIKEGEKWETSTSTIDTIKMEVPTIIKYTYTYSVYYQGLIDKKRTAE